MQPGDSLRLETPGGGGYGSPLDRPSELVAQDVRRGYYDSDIARRDYGVVIQADSGEADVAATARLRAARRA